MLPPTGGAALRTALGILVDHAVPVDVDRLGRLDDRLAATWTAEEWSRLDDADEREVELTIADAALLLFALSWTEAMSTELPWYPMVVETVRFVGDQLLSLWSHEEWLAHRSG
jgi:hypothetical protein